MLSIVNVSNLITKAKYRDIIEITKSKIKTIICLFNLPKPVIEKNIFLMINILIYKYYSNSFYNNFDISKG